MCAIVTVDGAIHSSDLLSHFSKSASRAPLRPSGRHGSQNRGSTLYPATLLGWMRIRVANKNHQEFIAIIDKQTLLSNDRLTATFRRDLNICQTEVFATRFRMDG